MEDRREKRVLVIDDHESVLGALEQVLETMGVSFIGAPDPATGLDLARTERPDLILCDYYMEGLNGLQVLGRLRGDAGTAAIPFVLMTMDDSLEARALEAGADGFVSKSAGDLITAIIEHVESKGGAGAAALG